MDINIKNCNNIKDANISVEKNSLNIKYGMNGTGKSTIAKAIENRENLTELKTFGSELEPEITIVGKLADPGNGGSERISLSEVSFDDLTLFDFEVGAVGATECPFTFTDMECIDLI